MSKSILLALAIALGAALWMAPALLNPPEKPQPEPLATDIAKQQADAEENLPQVRVQSMAAKPYVQRIMLNGRTQASKQVNLRAETEGRIIAFPHDEGEDVTAGTLIAQLDAKDREERLAEAEKILKQRKIEYNAAKSLETRGYNSRISLAQATSALETARAALKAAEDELAKTKIIAPFDGLLTNRNAEIGDFVRAGDGLITLAQLDPMEVTGYVSEHKITHIETGQTARIYQRGKHLMNGVISYTSPVADPATRTFEVKITLDNKDRRLVDGMTVEIAIPLDPVPAYEISPSALTLGPEGEIGVKLVNKDDRVLFHPIEILSDRPDSMWVSGLPDNIRLITLGQEFVRTDSLVKPVEAEQMLNPVP